MKQLIDRYSIICIMLCVCVICTSCSGEIQYDTLKEKNYKEEQDQGQEQEKLQVEDLKKDLSKNTGNASDMTIDTTENDSSVKVSGRNDEISKEFLQNFYDFTEQTSVHVFRENVSKNQIYAPLNWYLALSVLSELSAGEAREEIQEVLGISDAEFNASEVNTAIDTLEKRRLPLPIGRLDLNTSLWLNDEINYQEELLNMLQSQYSTEIYKGDLKNREFQNRITQWVYENTYYEFRPDYNKMLDNADPDAFICLNSLNFYNEWLFPFEEEDTTTEPFFLSDNKEITSDFMKMEKLYHPFMVGEDYMSTSCILKEHESMLFILPEEGLLIEDFIEKRGKLSSIISDWTNEQYSMGKVKLSVPKFAYSGETNLKTTAETMGINKIFDQNSSAFSGFADENIYITDIIQASKIEVDEKGCSASSYTEITAQGSGVSKDEVEINLNRPFIYILYKNKVPFLVGVVQNPS